VQQQSAGFGFGLAADELAADALDLLTDVELPDDHDHAGVAGPALDPDRLG